MMDSIEMMDKKKLLDIFEYLNERLLENQLQIEITVYGDSIMTMIYDNRPATRAIDLVFRCIAVPEWLRSNILRFEVPYYHSKRISDFEKFKLQMTNPGPFRARNVYFDLTGIGRI